MSIEADGGEQATGPFGGIHEISAPVRFGSARVL